MIWLWNVADSNPLQHQAVTKTAVMAKTTVNAAATVDFRKQSYQSLYADKISAGDLDDGFCDGKVGEDAMYQCNGEAHEEEEEDLFEDEPKMNMGDPSSLGFIEGIFYFTAIYIHPVLSRCIYFNFKLVFMRHWLGHLKLRHVWVHALLTCMNASACLWLAWSVEHGPAQKKTFAAQRTTFMRAGRATFGRATFMRLATVLWNRRIKSVHSGGNFVIGI
uniref:TLC domain-containing protein n=1 Tax=Panagrellus redivivus TaxID=6233 RepID=A0A7E4ZYN9_PANRE